MRNTGHKRASRFVAVLTPLLLTISSLQIGEAVSAATPSIVTATQTSADLTQVTAPAAVMAESAAALPAVKSQVQSEVVRTEVIGYSRQHRPITAYELGDPYAAFTAVVLGSMHGYYERAGEVVTKSLRSLPIPAGLNLWVIDTMNPDGDALHQRGNYHDVDLNRNWPDDWIALPNDPKDTFDNHYSGPVPLSEPETVAMYDFLYNVKPNRMVVMHQPLDGVDTTDGGARDPAFRRALATNLKLPQKAFLCWEACHGSMTGWLTHNEKGSAVTVEFPQQVGGAYLTSTAPKGILSALMVGRPPTISLSTAADRALIGTPVRFRGRLLAANGRPMAKAAVTVWGRVVGTNTWARVRLLHTDAEGNYSVSVTASAQPRDFRVTFDSTVPGQKASSPIHRLTGLYPPAVSLSLADDRAVIGQTVAFSGQLTAGGRPMAKVAVTIWGRVVGSSEWTRVRLLHADARGGYSGTVTASAKPRDYRVTFDSDGQGKAASPVHRLTGLHPVVSLRLATDHAFIGKSVAFSGRLTAGGHSMAGSTVVIWGLPAGLAHWTELGRVRTDVRGHFAGTVTSPWRPTAYRVVYDQGGPAQTTSSSARLAGVPHPVRIKSAVSGKTLTGSIVDTVTGRPVKAARIEVWLTKTVAGKAGKAVYLGTLISNAGGRFGTPFTLPKGARLQLYFRGGPSTAAAHT